MPTFAYSESAATNGGTFLLEVPSIQWFTDSVMTAIAEMTIPDNWYGDTEEFRTYAVNQASKMLATYKLLNFNPFPVGMIMPFGSSTPPEGYLPCDGQLYLFSDYPELFAQIGYYWGGSGDYFNVPDLRNTVVVGSGDTYAIAETGGESTHTLITSEIPSHDHGASAPTIIDPTHSHIEVTAIPTLITIGAGVPAPSAVPSVGSTVPALTGISALAPTIYATGGGVAHNNMQPFVAVPYIIYAGRI